VLPAALGAVTGILQCDFWEVVPMNQSLVCVVQQLLWVCCSILGQSPKTACKGTSAVYLAHTCMRLFAACRGQGVCGPVCLDEEALRAYQT
jgi:hypothetical protein